MSQEILSVELDLDKARHYLRKEKIIREAAVSWWNLAAFSGLGLGLMKVMPNRTNNYYPMEWRIRKEVGSGR